MAPNQTEAANAQPTPTRVLPDSYQLSQVLDMSRQRGLQIGLSALVLVLTPLCGWLFLYAASRLRSELVLSVEVSSIPALLGYLLGLVALGIGVVVPHELVHGLCFRFFTGEQPRYGFRGLYAYAAAPDWYLPRRAYVLIALAPLVVLSLLGLGLLPFVPQPVVLPLVLALTLNAAGSAGDLLVAVWVLRSPADALFRDSGDVVARFVRPSAFRR